MAICAASGALFSALHAPLPWMIGPLLAMALGKFLGANVARAMPDAIDKLKEVIEARRPA